MKSFFIIFISLLVFGFEAKGQDIVKIEKFEGLASRNLNRKVIDLSNHNIKDIPIEANNPSVEVLILDNNSIEELPNWISNLSNLRVLSIRSNNLKELNGLVTFCSNLEEIYLSGNKKLAKLPNLGRLPKIRIIDATDTNINDVPTDLRFSQSLYYFKFSKK